MALIGSLAINMAVETRRFARGLLDASRMIRNFQKSASRDFARGETLIRAGIADMGRGFGEMSTLIARGVAEAGRSAAMSMKLLVGSRLFASLLASAKGAAGDAAGVYLAGFRGLAARIVKVFDRLRAPVVASSRVTARYVSTAYADTVGRTAIPASFRQLGAGGMKQLGGPAVPKDLRGRYLDALKESGARSAGPGGGRSGLPSLGGVFGSLAAGAKAAVPAIVGAAKALAALSVGAAKSSVGLMLVSRGFAKLGAVAGYVGLRAAGSAATYAGKAFVHTFRFAEELASKLAIIGGVGALGLYKVVKAASSLAEQTDRARVMFGDSASEIIKESDLMAGAFGRSRAEFIGSASGIAGQLKGMGYASDAAAKLGVHFTKLAMDVASATQITDEEAFTRMASGLAGESEAVRRWGVDLTEANLKIQAVNRGIAKQGQELTQTQKVQIRSILMDEKLSYAKGNLAKTAGGAENAAKGLMGRLSNLAETIGTALLPIVGSALSELQVGVEALSMTWTAMTKGIVNESVGVVGSNIETAKSFGFVQSAIGFVADAFQNMSMTFSYVQSYITAGFGKLVGAAAKLGDAIGYLVSKITGMPPAENMLKAWAEDLSRLSGEQYKRFEAKANARPASEGINAAFSAAQERIKGMRSETMKPGINPADFKPAATGPAAAAGVPKFASAALVGSSEAANAQLRSRYGAGAGGKKPEEETAKNTRRIAQGIDRLLMSNREPVEIKGLPSWQLAAGAGALAGNF